MSESAFPHSPEYLARQVARDKDLIAERERLLWTDAQFLAERDAAYVAEQRKFIVPRIVNIEREMREDTDVEGYVCFYHTDEG